MNPHPFLAYTSKERYYNTDIDDLLAIETLNGYFNVNGKPPVLISTTHWKKGKGFDEITLSDKRDENKVLLREMQTPNGETRYVEGNKCVDIDNLFDDRIVIFPTLTAAGQGPIQGYKNLKSAFEANGTPYKYFNHQFLKSAKLLMLPVHLPGNQHFTFFVLDPKNEKGYYFDPKGRNNKFFEQYCDDIGYDYTHNEKWHQIDMTTCGPRAIEFASHVIGCIQKDQEITLDVPKFSIDKALEKHKKLLSSLLYPPNDKEEIGLAEIIKRDAHNYIFDCKFPTREISTDDVPIETYNNIPIITAACGFVVGAAVGFATTQFTNLNQILGIEGETANLIFRISSPIVCAAILGIIAYAVGNALSKD